MTGSILIKLRIRDVQYNLKLNRNYTVLQGDGSTGKTRFCAAIDDYNHGIRRGLALSVSEPAKTVRTLTDIVDWRHEIIVSKNTVFFIDEGETFVTTNEFAKCSGNSDNYFVLINRDMKTLPNLPISVHEVYSFHIDTRSQKYPVQEQVNTMIYMQRVWKPLKAKKYYVTKIVTEDAKTGCKFFRKAFSTNVVLPAAGKSMIADTVAKLPDKTGVLVVADSAAIAADFDKLLIYQQAYRFAIYLPESFEWFLLHSDCFSRFYSLPKKLNPETAGKYIDSKAYSSWEQYYTELLKMYCEKLGITYTKTGNLSHCFTNKKTIEILLKLLEDEGIDFSQMPK
jgi:hypothetical protein